MKVSDLLNGVIYAGALAGAMSGIGVFLHLMVVKPMRKFLSAEITTHLVQIRDAISSNGHEIAGLTQRFDQHLQEFHAHQAGSPHR